MWTVHIVLRGKQRKKRGGGRRERERFYTESKREAKTEMGMQYIRQYVLYTLYPKRGHKRYLKILHWMKKASKMD